MVVLRILGGVLDVRANGAGVGLEARRRFCPPCGVGQWLSAGTNTISLRNPYRMLRTDLAVAALFLSGHALTAMPGAQVVTVSRLRYSGVARSYFYSSKMGPGCDLAGRDQPVAVVTKP